MKISLDVRKGDMQNVLGTVKQHKRVPYAMLKAMNSWMFDANAYLKKDIDRHLEGGAENFTKSGFRVQKVTNKRNLYGNLHVSLQRKKQYLDRYYLKNIIQGGTVIPPRPDRKKLMQPVAGRVDLNDRGNLRRRKFAQLRNKKKQYFYGIPKGRQGENYRGLWERNADGTIKMIIALGKEQRRTPQLFPAADISLRRFRRFPVHFAREYKREVIKSMRRRQG